MKSITLCITTASAILLTSSFNLTARAETYSFAVTAVEIHGTKFWLPSSITVKKGDTVKIKAISKVPGANSVHGWAVDAFKVEQVIDDKGKEFEFVANKAGIFPIRCHLHQAHVGGQLVVLE